MQRGVGYGLVADTIDYGEWKTGTKAEGVGMAAMTFVTKVSAGFAGAIIGWINEMGVMRQRQQYRMPRLFLD